MKDQASALRQIVGNLKKQRDERPSEQGARLICVTSGKGGVGKTSIAVNLAISLVKKGLRVLLMDADFGLSNVDLMMGVSPPFDLSHVLSGKKQMRDVVAQGPGGVQVVAGGSGMRSLIQMTETQLVDIMGVLVSLEDIADMIILDTGAGITPLIMRMIRASQEAIVITTPEPTAIMDSYALVKSLASGKSDTQLRLIVNRARSAEEGEAAIQKFLAVVRLYLKNEIVSLGYLLNDTSVEKGVRQQQPFVLSYPRSVAAKNIEEIAWKLMGATPNQTPGGLGRFVMGLLGRDKIRTIQPEEQSVSSAEP
ncbi:MAG: MinD/ParA family protein [Oscillospiraceae bacterium]|nr:MinD/ParA family protein [Oscillospiraceae bacterium]